jgi:hypothetical protein
MGLLDSLLANPGQQQEYQDFVGRYQQGAPHEGYTDQEVMQRYQQVAPNLSPQEYQAAGQSASLAGQRYRDHPVAGRQRPRAGVGSGARPERRRPYSQPGQREAVGQPSGFAGQRHDDDPVAGRRRAGAGVGVRATTPAGALIRQARSGGRDAAGGWARVARVAGRSSSHCAVDRLRHADPGQQPLGWAPQGLG